MYKLEKKPHREQRFQFHNQTENPSFSSTLLDEIYRSIDEGERKNFDMKFYTETTINYKQSKTNAKCNRAIEVPNIHLPLKRNEKSHHDHEIHNHDQDVMFFSSTSSSSDSSSGLLSSFSDTESMYRAKSRVSSCFAPLRPKPVKTSVTTEKFVTSEDDGLIKSKSRALKIYNNLKKVKQPISPGGKLSSFLNSLFTNNTKKTKFVSSSYENMNAERKAKSGQVSTCSSVSSFSRSCLSKNSPATREKLRSGDKRTVRFYPVSVIVDEDNRPCGHKNLFNKKNFEEEIVDKSKRVEEVAREFLREYHMNHKILRDISMRKNEVEDEDDDVASCSSSDLFELDHLAVMGNDNRYCEDLPVFETTRVISTNRVIRIM